MAKIMLVDDEKEIVDLIELYLKNEGHEVAPFYEPLAALSSDLSHIDAAVIDVMMPGIDGFTLCRKLRDEGHTFPVIMLTAKDGDTDKISGLMLGADDYMVKPFNPLELLARISAQLRRATKFSPSETPDTSDILEACGIVLDIESHRCTLYDREIWLTPIEFDILRLLMSNKGKVISSEHIFETVWGEKYFDNNNTVMVHVQKLRKKLDDTGKKKKIIQTVWGVGYKIEK